MVDWKEVTDLKTLSKVKSVEEMIPRTGANQVRLANPKIWEEQYRIIEDALRMDCTIEEACMYAWISVPSYYKHREKDEDFAVRMDRARQFPKMMARAAVMRRIAQWDSKTALRYLELRDKRFKPDHQEEEQWSWKTKVEFTLVKTINEWVDQQTSDSQSATEQNSASDSSVTLLENRTPWENAETVLGNLD